MSNRKEKPIELRILSCVCAFLLIGAAFYVSLLGFTLYSGVSLGVSLLGLMLPVVIAAENIADFFSGLITSFWDGLMEVFGGIADFFSSIFSW